jgi:hypothetical protein
MKFELCMVAVVLLLFPAVCGANELRQETLQAWEQYHTASLARMQQRVDGQAPFLWLEESPERMQRVRDGEALVEPIRGQGPSKVPHGMIHDWIGAIFLPKVQLDDVLRILSDYGHYADFYKPTIVQSKLLESSGDDEKVHLLLMQKAFSVTAAVETDDDVHLTVLDADKAYSLSDAVHVQEIADYGKPQQRPFPEDHGPGYVWRTFTLTRVEEKDGGVYLEVETVEMSRGIPFEFRWLIKPLTDRLPRDLMLATLKDTQQAVNGAISAASEKQVPQPPALR